MAAVRDAEEEEAENYWGSFISGSEASCWDFVRCVRCGEHVPIDLAAEHEGCCKRRTSSGSAEAVRCVSCGRAIPADEVDVHAMTCGPSALLRHEQPMDEWAEHAEQNEWEEAQSQPRNEWEAQASSASLVQPSFNPHLTSN